MTYNVDRLPKSFTLGRRTETGVEEVRINCYAWLERWPNLRLSLWVTPPSGAPYIAATHMDGTELVFPITDTDTAFTGRGTAEVIGEAQNVRKLSAIVEVNIL